jgi:hypothetical protein
MMVVIQLPIPIVDDSNNTFEKESIYITYKTDEYEYTYIIISENCRFRS